MNALPLKQDRKKYNKGRKIKSLQNKIKRTIKDGDLTQWLPTNMYTHFKSYRKLKTDMPYYHQIPVDDNIIELSAGAG